VQRVSPAVFARPETSDYNLSETGTHISGKGNMELATLYTRALNGINAVNVTVEVHLSNGLPAFSIVGLPEAAVRESAEQIKFTADQYKLPAKPFNGFAIISSKISNGF
jgi:hypothetical protein